MFPQLCYLLCCLNVWPGHLLLKAQQKHKNEWKTLNRSDLVWCLWSSFLLLADCGAKTSSAVTCFREKHPDTYSLSFILSALTDFYFIVSRAVRNKLYRLLPYEKKKTSPYCEGPCVHTHSNCSPSMPRGQPNRPPWHFAFWHFDRVFLSGLCLHMYVYTSWYYLYACLQTALHTHTHTHCHIQTSAAASRWCSQAARQCVCNQRICSFTFQLFFFPLPRSVALSLRQRHTYSLSCRLTNTQSRVFAQNWCHTHIGEKKKITISWSFKNSKSLILMTQFNVRCRKPKRLEATFKLEQCVVF